MTIIVPFPMYRSTPSSSDHTRYGNLQNPAPEEYEHLPAGTLFSFIYHTGEKDSLLGMSFNWVSSVYRRVEGGVVHVPGTFRVAHTRKGVEKQAREMMSIITNGTQRYVLAD